jgi:hypothetical protein
MFQFPAFALSLQVFNLKGFPIQTSMDQRSFAPPHGFSQLTTSFIASESLGIPRMPFIASFSPFFFRFDAILLKQYSSPRALTLYLVVFSNMSNNFLFVKLV